MKIIFSLVLLGALALIIRKLGLKKTEEIAKEVALHPFKVAAQIIKASETNTDANKTAADKELTTDQASLTALETEYKSVLDKIATLQHEQKWGVKDEHGFYYSVDKDGVLFSGGNSSDEYNTMVGQLKDYTDKKAVLTKKIAGETKPQSLELPLELQAILSAIKAKLHFSVDEDNNDDAEQGNNNDYDNRDYGNYGSYGNDGGSGAFPYQPAVVTPITATTTTPLFSSILNTPIKAEPLQIKSLGNLSNILNGLGITPQVTPTPKPNIPVINTVHTNTGSNTRTSNARTNNNYSHRHGGRRRF
jgi:hypothetical protein